MIKWSKKSFFQCWFAPLWIKLMRLGVKNRIINNLDSKQANFDHQFRSDSDFNLKINSTIAVLIKFYCNFDHNRSIWLKSIDFNLFWSFFWLKDQKRPSKFQLFTQKVDLCQKWSKITGFLINFDTFNQIQTIFDINRLFQFKSGKI